MRIFSISGFRCCAQRNHGCSRCRKSQICSGYGGEKESRIHACNGKCCMSHIDTHVLQLSVLLCKLIEYIFHLKEKSKSAKTSEEIDLEKARQTEQRLKLEIGRLKKEIDRVHRTWEKKFAILQQR